mmetsp:Transcript_24682/g.53852  ORF Transcript_24682/g.53852 Transcript_24682/m.53852 type:complete len:146 (-) Transcript_24682:175-612(-)|eukprot:CAMPEP_0118950494 /NCGR_PEP_ID=MMETSP1169-20130426/51471_1 /TAXON_ID=36882 /ORGANISM="Pyramimonas obovata, Strain CCMP722" /LENGTH=145 /DNA_ID=CAMNT_0006897345 /DNA_START=236 /DNA_END=673 /DNA_ORIENTATION=+
MSKKVQHDYTLHAVKVFISQLQPCLEQDRLASWQSSGCWSLPHSGAGAAFQRVWIQGVVVADGPDIATIDDGTDCIDVSLRAWLKREHNEGLKTGEYVLVIGGLIAKNDRLTIKAHKVVALNGEVDREAVWYLDVMCVNRLRTAI